VWRGMIKVDPGAQRTDAFQESRNLLLSKRAHADAIPGLEILANDVRCTHAAAIAQIDRDQLFYLRAHGLPEPDANRLVIEGFLQALVERFEEGPVRERVAGGSRRCWGSRARGRRSATRRRAGTVAPAASAARVTPGPESSASMSRLMRRPARPARRARSGCRPRLRPGRRGRRRRARGGPR
jgi:hypothetical protein